ncbi:hypothetical protein BpHYR1_051872 [Brachionus plicatilis]|uniref:Uncharacterized protein n=1 Tax=Brachionus plicatilis TaxID=10195 RepID=A0A3M7REZ0_BRAPC|nr:hypothetical protein BpHYR1_051872 [Brachionus plicatilis]
MIENLCQFVQVIHAKNNKINNDSRSSILITFPKNLIVLLMLCKGATFKVASTKKIVGLVGPFKVVGLSLLFSGLFQECLFCETGFKRTLQTPDADKCRLELDGTAIHLSGSQSYDFLSFQLNLGRVGKICDKDKSMFPKVKHLKVIKIQ